MFFVAAFSGIQATELGIHKAAAGVLSLGVGVQGGRILADRPARARLLGGRTAAALAVLSLLIGLGRQRASQRPPAGPLARPQLGVGGVSGRFRRVARRT